MKLRPLSLLFAGALTPLVGALLTGAFLLTTPSAVIAANTCGYVIKIGDGDAQNAWMGTSADTATELASYGWGQETNLVYPGYTNDVWASADVYANTATSCATLDRYGTFYTLASGSPNAIAGFGYGSSAKALTTSWSQIMYDPGAISNSGFDSSPDYAALDLSTNGAYTPGSFYMDAVNCNYVSLGSTYVRRTGGATNGAYGAWGWLYLTATNQYSATDNTPAGYDGGGAGDPADPDYLNFTTGTTTGYMLGNSGCLAPVSGPAKSTIIYDVTSPTFTVSINAGAAATGNNIVSFTVGSVTDGWLMAASNDTTCDANASFEDWRSYATTSQTNWDLTSYNYAWGATATVCVRVMDKAGNIGYGKDTITYDVYPPVASWSTTATSSTKATAISYTLSFDETVTGLTKADLYEGGSNSCTMGTLSGSGASYTLAYTCPTNASGTIMPVLRGYSVVDTYTNTGPEGDVAAPMLTLDWVAPTVSSFVLRQELLYDTGTSQTDGITNAATLTYRLIFNEKVTGLAAADFTRSGSATGCGTITVSSVSVSGNPSGSAYDIGVPTCSEGTVTLTLAINTVADVATNAGPLSTASASALIDRSGPTGCVLSIAGGAATTSSPTNALTLSGCAGLNLGTDQMRFSNNASTYSAYEPYVVSKASWDLTAASTGGSSTEGTRTVTAQVGDIAGNISTTTDTILFDQTAPVVTFTSPISGTCGTINSPCTNLAAYPLAYAISDGTGSGISATVPTTLTRYKATFVSGGCPASGYSVDVVEYPTGNSQTSFLSTGLTNGNCYYWALKTTDAVGNQAAGSSVKLLVDQVAPIVSSFIVGDGSGVTTSPLLTASISATDTLTGMAKARWSLANGADWSGLTCAQSALAYTTGRSYNTSLSAGGGDYGVTSEVCDYAGNSTTITGVIKLNSLKRMPVLTLGAEVRSCTATGTTLSTNTSGVIYWPVGSPLCFYPKPQQRTAGTDTTNGRNWTGQLDATTTTSYTVTSVNPCTSPCAGLVGLYPSTGLNSYTIPAGQQLVTTAGQSTWVVPTGVTSISAVAVGAGGGGRAQANGGAGGAGGSLAYATKISVTPGETLYLTVGAGGTSGSVIGGSGGLTAIRRGSQIGTDLLIATGGGGGSSTSATATVSTGGLGSTAGCVAGTVCFAGGAGGNAATNTTTGGGGGAGGYTGAGGAGSTTGVAGNVSSGGGGGGGGGGGSANGSGGGGGVGLLGPGTNGSGGAAGTLGLGGGAGSSGSAGAPGTSTAGGSGGSYGGGAGGADDTAVTGTGAQGAIRIIYGYSSNVLRAYPSTGVADASGSTAAAVLTMRLDRETSSATSSLPAVSVTVLMTVTVKWYDALNVLQATSTYPVTLELRVKSLGVGQRPG